MSFVRVLESACARPTFVLLVLASAACTSTGSVWPLKQSVDPDAGYRSAFYAANGILVAGRAQASWLEGDFDGDTTLVGPDTIFVPDADDGTGYEVAVGVMKDGDAYRLTYSHLHYDGSIGSAESEVDYSAFGLDWTHYFRANEPAQPFVLLGMLVPFADLEDASTDGVSIDDGKLRAGFGMQIAAGLAWWFAPGLALDVRAEYVYQWFDEAEGVAGDEDEIDDPVDAWGYGVSAGLTWIIGG